MSLNPELSAQMEKYNKKIISEIESAEAAVIILRRHLTPPAVYVAPWNDPRPGAGGFFSGKSISLETLFHLKGIDSQLREVFDRETIEIEGETTEIYSGFIEDGKQKLVNILDKRTEFVYQESGMDPAGQINLDDMDEATKRIYRANPWSTGTWYPEQTSNS